MTPAPGLYKGQSYYGQGEQILFGQKGQSRVAFPDAGDPSNIEFVKKGGEHLSRHNGNYRNPSSGKKINRD